MEFLNMDIVLTHFHGSHTSLRLNLHNLSSNRNSMFEHVKLIMVIWVQLKIPMFIIKVKVKKTIDSKYRNHYYLCYI